MNLIKTFGVFASLLTLCVDSLNILCILPYEGKSHFFVFKTFLLELERRGHNLTVISHFPEKSPPANYHDISLAGTSDIFEDAMPLKRNYWTLISTGLFLSWTGTSNCDAMLQNKRVQGLVKNKQKFDVALVELFNSDCGLGLAYKLGAPVVSITTHILMPWHYKRFGIPDNPSYVPYHFLEGGSKPTLYQKIERIVFDVYVQTLYYYWTQRNNQNSIARYIGEVLPLEELGRQAKFVLLYHNFVLTGSRLFPPNVIEVGGYHVGKAKPLTGALRDFVANAEHGVVYISFGSVVKSSTLSAEKLEAILAALDEFPQKFVWKWENETQLEGRKNLYVSSWLPQIDILAHPKTVAFFSHSGMLSTTEAIHFGVPMVAMPVLGDQPANAASIEECGLGVQIQYRELTKDSLVAALKKVLDPEYRQQVKALSKTWHDRPMSPMDAAVFWTEFAARHPNTTFRTAAADVWFYEYMYLDVLSVIVVFISVTVWLVRLVCCRVRKQDVKKPKAKAKPKRH